MQFVGRLKRGVGPVVLGAVAAIVAAGVALLLWRRDAVGPGARSHVLVLAEFQNFTSDPALGVLLAKVLQIDLAQSPFFRLISHARTKEPLAQHRAKPASQPAADGCDRDQRSAVLNGTVSRAASSFVVTLEARDCRSGAQTAQGRARASHEDDIPSLLDTLTIHLRETMGEPSASIGKFDLPIAQTATSSFESLKAFSQGEKAREGGDEADALTLFQRATELDPSFAMAYGELANSYYNLNEMEPAKANFRQAFALRDHTSENETLQLSCDSFRFLGNFTESIRGCRTWAETYPQDGRPWVALADLQTRIGRYQDAIAAGRQALVRDPEDPAACLVLARALRMKGMVAQSRAAYEKLFALWKGVDQNLPVLVDARREYAQLSVARQAVP